MSVQLETIRPTLLFSRGDRGLRQGLHLTITNEGPPLTADLLFKYGSEEELIELGTVETGRKTKRVFVPDVRQAMQVEVALRAQGKICDKREITWKPERHWKVYVVPVSHHDLGYTDLPSNVRREHCRFMDEIVRFCEETEDFPEESKFRYNVEQAWSILPYFDQQPPEMVEKLLKYIREGRIEVMGLLGNETSELCGHEEQIRLTYPAFRLKRRFGVPIRAAELNDVPGLSWGLASVLAGSGIRYFAPALPDYNAWGDNKVHALWDEEAVIPRGMLGAFWWEGPDGNKVLLWSGFFGLEFWTHDQVRREMPRALAGLARRDYPFDLVRFAFTGGRRDNSPPDKRISLIAREWNDRWAYPKMIVATDSLFFQALEQKFGSQLRTLRGDLPNTDYTIGATSTAEATGVNRLTHDALLSAEKLASVASLVSDYEYPADVLAEAYDCSLLYDEHTWGNYHLIGPGQEGTWRQKSEWAYRSAALAHEVLVQSSNRIADQLQLRGRDFYLLVLNPLSIPRTEVVRAPAAMPTGPLQMYWKTQPARGKPFGSRLVCGSALGRDVVNLPPSVVEGTFELIDCTTGKSVPFQIVTLKDPLAPRPRAPYSYAMGATIPAFLKELAFVAEDVPPMGYKTYRIAQAKKHPSFESSVRIQGNVIENRFYKITLDSETGAVSGILDKELNRDWVDANAPHGFNQVVVRSAQTGQESIPTSSTISRGEAGPVFASLVVKGDALGCPQRLQEIILYDSIKRIDFASRLLKDPTPLLEYYFAFPFALANTQFRYEASNAVIQPIHDQLPGSNTDAYAMQHWVSAWDDSGAVAWTSLEAPIVELGGLWPSPVSQAHHNVRPPGYGHEVLHDPSQPTKGHVYSYIMVNNFRTNFQAVQSGDRLFRYSMTSHKGDWRQGKARDFGWGVSNPLVPVCIRGPQKGPLPESASFCHVDQPNVFVLTIKAAEDGNGLIVRLVETEGKAAEVTVSLPFFEIAEAFRTNLVEEDVSPLDSTSHTVKGQIDANGFLTIRLCGDRRWPAVTSLARF